MENRGPSRPILSILQYPSALIGIRREKKLTEVSRRDVKRSEITVHMCFADATCHPVFRGRIYEGLVNIWIHLARTCNTNIPKTQYACVTWLSQLSPVGCADRDLRMGIGGVIGDHDAAVQRDCLLVPSWPFGDGMRRVDKEWVESEIW